MMTPDSDIDRLKEWIEEQRPLALTAQAKAYLATAGLMLKIIDRLRTPGLEKRMPEMTRSCETCTSYDPGFAYCREDKLTGERCDRFKADPSRQMIESLRAENVALKTQLESSERALDGLRMDYGRLEDIGNAHLRKVKELEARLASGLHLPEVDLSGPIEDGIDYLCFVRYVGSENREGWEFVQHYKDWWVTARAFEVLKAYGPLPNGVEK